MPAAKFFKKYFDDRGYFQCVVRWGANDGPDDAFENFDRWPELHALGASDEILQMYLKAWEGMLQQYTEAKTTDVPIARQGMYYKEFIVQSDWMHHGEGLQLFNRMGLSVPTLTRPTRSGRGASPAFYMGEDPEAPNYDPEHKIIRSMVNGSRGPMLRKATALDWVGDPFDVEGLRRPARRATASSSSSRTTRNTATSSAITSSIWSPRRCRSNAYLLAGEPKYKTWLVEYMDAWLGADEAERRHHPELRRSRRHDRRARRQVVEQRLRLGIQPGESGDRPARGPQPHSARARSASATRCSSPAIRSTSTRGAR